MKQKHIFLFVLILLSIIILSQTISAQYSYYNNPVENTINRVVWSTIPWVSYILGYVPTAEILFIKFLVFLLILAITNFAIKRVPGLGEDKKVAIIISIIVALLAARYMTTEALINMIWLPYGVLGVLLSSLLPLIIFFFFIESFDSSFLRKVGWVFFIVIYSGLAYYRYGDFQIGPAWWQNLAMIYALIAIICLLIFIFEKKIHQTLLISAIRKGYDSKNIILKTELQKELDKINKTLASTYISNRESSKLKEEKRRIERAIARIS